jgi:DNA-binding NarL/FixJ family response regulator
MVLFGLKAISSIIESRAKKTSEQPGSRNGDAMIRIVVADDHEIMRAGLRGAISQQENWTVCAEAANGVEAVSKVVELKPDVVILDITMPVMSGLEAAIKIRQLSPSTRIIILSMHDAVLMANVLALAAPDAYLSKTTPTHDLIQAITAVMSRPPSAPPRRAPPV